MILPALVATLAVTAIEPGLAGFRYVAPEVAPQVAPRVLPGVPPAAEQDPSEPVARGPVPIPAGAPGADAAGASADPGEAVIGTSVSGTSVSGTSVSHPRVSGTSVWRVREGEMLRAALARWGVRAGVDVLFLTDRRYRLEAAASFGGGFVDAVQTLFRGLSHLPHPPAASRSEGAALVVRHRLREGTQEEDVR